MIKNIICFLFVIIHCNVTAQPTQEVIDIVNAEMKYWKLRARFLGDEDNLNKYSGFTSVGDGQGQSLVFQLKLPNSLGDNWEYSQILGGHCFGQFNNSINGSSKDPRDQNVKKGHLQTGENPFITQGRYLAVLATEWALLHQNGQSTSDLEQELFYALNAINRLDIQAEVPYGFNIPVNNHTIS
jgi:hypothetical protein